MGFLTMALAVSVRRFAPALCAGILLSIVSTNVFADERCAQLIALDKEYRGVTLTEEQKAIKVQMVAWYRANCGRPRPAAGRQRVVEIWPGPAAKHPAGLIFRKVRSTFDCRSFPLCPRG